MFEITFTYSLLITHNSQVKTKCLADETTITLNASVVPSDQAK